VRVLLLHNSNAGDEGLSEAALIKAFKKAGHKVTYAATRGRGWKRAVKKKKADVIVAAGGDGTARKVALALAKHAPATPLSLVPAGVANNIAAALGIEGTAQEIAAGLESAKPSKLAIGLARGPWGKARFVESAGVGVFASMLDEPPAPDLASGARRLQERLSSAKPRNVAIEADGLDLSGKYVLALAMNIGSIGARLVLAPRADVSKGLLQVLLVGEQELPALLQYLECIVRGAEAAIGLDACPARHVTMQWAPARGHIDDEQWPEDGAKRANVTLAVDSFLPVLVPSRV
jgi:diacylglycerol kinase family enzyme